MRLTMITSTFLYVLQQIMLEAENLAYKSATGPQELLNVNFILLVRLLVKAPCSPG